MEFQTKQELLKYLPFLRRYARALTGHQQSADALVLATIQSLSLANSVPDSGGYRERLYRAFTKIWAGPAGEHIRALAVTNSGRSSVEKRLAALPSQARQAFLLSSVEDFDDTQISRILGINPVNLPEAKAQARAAITRQVKTSVLIIEDEMFIATDLEEIMVSLGHEVVAIERTHADAVAAICTTKPGLILADIQLADGSSGIDAVNEILDHCEVPVVFITAYPERLLTGLRPEPAFVLTKPFKTETVRAVVSQALFFETRAKSGVPKSESPVTAATTETAVTAASAETAATA